MVLLRKGFITLNAVIGIWLMFKVTGWNEGSFFMSAAAIGSSYMEFFVTFIYKAYDWLYSLFDNKVVPNIPNNNLSQFNGWNIRPMKENNYLSLAENAKSWYQSPTQINANNSWSDWIPSAKTLFYIGITVVTIATLYSGYVYINDWFCSTAASNNIDPKGKGPEIHIESPGGTINGNNKSICISGSFPKNLN